MMMNLILCRGIPARVNKGWQRCEKTDPMLILRKCFERCERFQFAPDKPKCVRGNQMKPIWNLRCSPYPNNRDSSEKIGQRYCHQHPRSTALHLYSALLTWPTWWFDESCLSRCSLMSIWILIFFCVCVSLSVFLSWRPLTVSRDTSVDPNPVFF